jgi:hypothetical protein
MAGCQHFDGKAEMSIASTFWLEATTIVMK